MKTLYWIFGIWLVLYLGVFLFGILPLVIRDYKLRIKIEKDNQYIESLNNGRR